MMESFPTFSNNSSVGEVKNELSVTYVVCEIIVALFAVIGNAFVILVFYRERKLRRRTNYYIVSLAVADLLVGLLGIPFAILASVGMPTDLHLCLFTVSLLVVLCTISIFCLVAVSVDRYWAILHPMGYSRNVRTRTAIGIIGVCWASGTLVGFLPLLGWHKGTDTDVQCYFTAVMNYDYLVFLYFGTIIIPALLMAGFYAHIYRVVLKQVRRIVTMNPAGGGRPAGGGTMLRVLGATRKREVKATQNLSIIVLFFIVCWIPLYTINCIQAFCSHCDIPIGVTNFFIILSHANSAINPLLYAYHLRDFQAALKNLICCILGVKSEEEINNTRVGRYGSHNTLHQPGLHTPSRNNSLQSIHQSRLLHSTQCTKSTVISSSRLSPASSNTLVNTIMSSMSSIGTLPLGDDQHKRMWTLKEVPSGSEDDGKSSVELRGENRGRKKSQGEWSSGQVNSAYIEEGIVLDYDEDDDVFIPEPIATLSVVDLKNQNRTSEHYNDISESQFELCVRNSKLNSNREKNGGSGIKESRFENQSESPLILEIERNNIAVDDNETTELAESKLKTKATIVARDGRNCRNNELVKNNGEELVKTNTSHSNQRLSPLKIVGEFLFPSNIRKLNCAKEESSVESFKTESMLTEESDATVEDRKKNGCALKSSDTRDDEMLPK